MDKTFPPNAIDKRRPFDGSEAAPLDLPTAARWTANERRLHPEQVKAYFFGRQIIEHILAQPGCMGLRVHYATNPDSGQRHLLIVGADAQHNDQLPHPHLPRPVAPAAVPTAGPAPAPGAAPVAVPTAGPAAAPVMLTGSREPIIAEMSIPCPNQCGDGNDLNGH